MNVKPFDIALKMLSKKKTTPTPLGSEDIKQISPKILRSALFSARTTHAGYLEKIRKTVDNLLNPKSVRRTDEDGTTRMVNEGFNYASAREELEQSLKSIGYSPNPKDAGTIKDLSSQERLELVLRTNVEMSQGFGQMVQGMEGDVLQEWPAWELFRAEDRKEKRNWFDRWRDAAIKSGDQAALKALEQFRMMAALKSSPIWDVLGTVADDGLGNPYPPYAFNSGMWIRDVGRDRAVEIGLCSENQEIARREIEFKEPKSEL